MLNLYSSNHPLIQIWVSHICYTEVSDYELIKIVQKISICLIFEIMRKSISLNTLYIKQLHYITKIHLLPSQLSYIIISDVHSMHIIDQDTFFLIPECILHSVYFYKNNNAWAIKYMFNNVSKDLFLNKKIIVFEPYLDKARTTLLISCITKYTKCIDQIQICCIICPIDVLQFINKSYSNITIYTAKVIDNNQSQSIKHFWKALQNS